MDQGKIADAEEKSQSAMTTPITPKAASEGLSLDNLRCHCQGGGENMIALFELARPVEYAVVRTGQGYGVIRSERVHRLPILGGAWWFSPVFLLLDGYESATEAMLAAYQDKKAQFNDPDWPSDRVGGFVVELKVS